MPRSRTYVIGLPVAITVTGREVIFEVDLTEADDLFEGIPTDDNLTPLVSEARVVADELLVSAAAARLHHTIIHRVHRSTLTRRPS